MRWQNIDAFWYLFVAVFVLLPAYSWSFWRKRRALRVLAASEMLKRINYSVSIGRQVFKALLLVLGFVVIVIALAQPGWNPRPVEISRRGRDIVILLDTSRSMLAAEHTPASGAVARMWSILRPSFRGKASCR